MQLPVIRFSSLSASFPFSLTPLAQYTYSPLDNMAEAELDLVAPAPETYLDNVLTLQKGITLALRNGLLVVKGMCTEA
jgi:hypothetical protein